MLFIMASFMHMLTLNQDALGLLKQSKLIQKFYKISLEPHKYHKYVAARRRDDFNAEQMVQNVANADPEISDQIFQTLIEVTK